MVVVVAAEALVLVAVVAGATVIEVVTVEEAAATVVVAIVIVVVVSETPSGKKKQRVEQSRQAQASMDHEHARAFVTPAVEKVLDKNVIIHPCGEARVSENPPPIELDAIPCTLLD